MPIVALSHHLPWSSRNRAWISPPHLTHRFAACIRDCGVLRGDDHVIVTRLASCRSSGAPTVFDMQARRCESPSQPAHAVSSGQRDSGACCYVVAVIHSACAPPRRYVVGGDSPQPRHRWGVQVLLRSLFGVSRSVQYHAACCTMCRTRRPFSHVSFALLLQLSQHLRSGRCCCLELLLCAYCVQQQPALSFAYHSPCSAPLCSLCSSSMVATQKHQCLFPCRSVS
jgi:hypothetical protein